MTIFQSLLELNTRDGVVPAINTEIFELISKQIGFGLYRNQEELSKARDIIVSDLEEYSKVNNKSTVVLGMSGGIDSALTASLFKSAGYNVIGMTLPIHQDPSETQRGVEACEALELEHIQVDLTEPYETLVQFYRDSDVDFNLELVGDNMRRQQIRKGNIRARLRMITLYNMAAKHHGFVASTDNFSELAAGFWTLHGDVGDVAPIQSLTKSWEVPNLALLQNIPASIIEAKPTDGLGVANGDEDQFGFTYLEFDAILFALIRNIDFSQNLPDTNNLVDAVKKRIASTSFKRFNPTNLEHPLEGITRYNELKFYDKSTQIGD